MSKDQKTKKSLHHFQPYASNKIDGPATTQGISNVSMPTNYSIIDDPLLTGFPSHLSRNLWEDWNDEDPIVNNILNNRQIPTSSHMNINNTGGSLSSHQLLHDLDYDVQMMMNNETSTQMLEDYASVTHHQSHLARQLMKRGLSEDFLNMMEEENSLHASRSHESHENHLTDQNQETQNSQSNMEEYVPIPWPQQNTSPAEKAAVAAAAAAASSTLLSIPNHSSANKSAIPNLSTLNNPTNRNTSKDTKNNSAESSNAEISLSAINSRQRLGENAHQPPQQQTQGQNLSSNMHNGNGMMMQPGYMMYNPMQNMIMMNTMNPMAMNPMAMVNPMAMNVMAMNSMQQINAMNNINLPGIQTTKLPTENSPSKSVPVSSTAGQQQTQTQFNQMQNQIAQQLQQMQQLNPMALQLQMQMAGMNPMAMSMMNPMLNPMQMQGMAAMNPMIAMAQMSHFASGGMSSSGNGGQDVINPVITQQQNNRPSTGYVSIARKPGEPEMSSILKSLMDEEAKKKEKKLERNRDSARESRRKQQSYVEILESGIKRLSITRDIIVTHQWGRHGLSFSSKDYNSSNTSHTSHTCKESLDIVAGNSDFFSGVHHPPHPHIPNANTSHTNTQSSIPKVFQTLMWNNRQQRSLSLSTDSRQLEVWRTFLSIGSQLIGLRDKLLELQIFRRVIEGPTSSNPLVRNLVSTLQLSRQQMEALAAHSTMIFNAEVPRLVALFKSFFVLREYARLFCLLSPRLEEYFWSVCSHEQMRKFLDYLATQKDSMERNLKLDEGGIVQNVKVEYFK